MSKSHLSLKLNLEQGHSSLQPLESQPCHHHLLLQQLDRLPSEGHFPAQSPPLLGPEPAGEQPHQRQPREPRPQEIQDPAHQGLPLPPDGRLLVAPVQPHVPDHLRRGHGPGGERRAGPQVHGPGRAKDGPAAGDGCQDTAGDAKRRWRRMRCRGSKVSGRKTSTRARLEKTLTEDVVFR